MGRKRRGTVPLRKHNLRFTASKWLKEHKDTPFNNPYLTEQLGLNPILRTDCSKVYQDVISYWRKKFIDEYRKYKKDGKLDGLNRYDAWDVMLYNYNQNDAYVFLFDRSTGSYVQPDFDELEEMDKFRLEQKWKGITSIISEMQLVDAQLIIPSGEKRPVSELLNASKKVGKLLNKK